VVKDVEGLGRLLFFDPTDAYTPLGNLPRDEQGSHALVIAPVGGTLVQMPLLPVAARRTERTVQASLSPGGVVEATVNTTYHGGSGGYWRMLAARDEKALRKVLEASYSAQIGGLALGEIKPGPAGDTFQLGLALRAPGYGQLMMERMLVFKPGALAGATDYDLPARERTSPVRLQASLRQDRVVIALPPGFAIDELPEPLAFSTPLGSYSGEWKLAGADVVFTQSIEIADSLTPASEYARVREFFSKITGAQSAPVVLVKR
jgi:hypothetical protein